MHSSGVPNPYSSSASVSSSSSSYYQGIGSGIYSSSSMNPHHHPHQQQQSLSSSFLPSSSLSTYSTASMYRSSQPGIGLPSSLSQYGGSINRPSSFSPSSPSSSLPSLYTGSTASSSHSSNASNSLVQRILRYFRKGLSWSQVDIEYLAYQFIYILLSPSKVYKLTTLRKQTKNTWSREDASFTYLLMVLLVPTSIAWSLAYGTVSFGSILFNILTMESQFFLSTIILTTLCWYIANTYLRVFVPLPHSVEQSIDWIYSWDTCCNSFVPYFIGTYILQYLCLPILLPPLSTDTANNNISFVMLLLGNSLYGISSIVYWYNIFSGYLVLPFIARANIFLVPGIILFILSIVATLFGINITSMLIGSYIT